MKNHPIKKVKLWHRLILILSMYLTACSAYNAFSASMHTISSPSQKSCEQLDIPVFNFNMLPSPSPCPSFMSLSSSNMYNPSPFPLNSSFSMSLSNRQMYSPSPCPLNSRSFSPFPKNSPHSTETDSVKKKWFDSVITDNLSTLQYILANYIFDVNEVSPKKGIRHFLSPVNCKIKE